MKEDTTEKYLMRFDEKKQHKISLLKPEDEI